MKSMQKYRFRNSLQSNTSYAKTLLFNDRGSITLEAAIGVPIFLIIISSILMAVIGIRAEIHWQGAQHKAGREFGLSGTLVSEQLDELMTAEKGVSKLLEGGITSQLTGPLVLSRLWHWFESDTQAEPGLNQYIASPIVYITKETQQNLTRLKTSFEIPTLIGYLTRRQQGIFPDWSLSGGLDLGDHSKSESDELDDDSIWSEGNFVRGLYFRELLGSNLPTGYPTIANFSEGKAVGIKSIDLTAPTYKKADYIKQKVIGHITALSNFKGTNSPWGSAEITIEESDIKSKELIVIVPENSPISQLNILKQCQSIAAEAGVNLVIEKIGVSERYIK